MTHVVLSPVKALGQPWFNFIVDTPQLDPAIDAKALSLCAFPMDATTGIPFRGAVLFNQPNYTGTSLVITQGGSVDDLSQSPWGNLANWIRSVKVEWPSLNAHAEIDKFLREKNPNGRVIRIDTMPDKVPVDVASCVVSPGSIGLGGQSTMTVTLTAPAPSGGLTVKIDVVSNGSQDTLVQTPTGFSFSPGATTYNYLLQTDSGASNPATSIDFYAFIPGGSPAKRARLTIT